MKSEKLRKTKARQLAAILLTIMVAAAFMPGQACAATISTGSGKVTARTSAGSVYSIPDSLSLKVGESKTLNLTMNEKNGETCNVGWQTSPNYADISNSMFGSYWGKPARTTFTGSKTGSFTSFCTVKVFNRSKVQVDYFSLEVSVTVNPGPAVTKPTAKPTTKPTSGSTTGKRSKSKSKVSISKTKIKVKNAVYNGKKKKPKVTVKYGKKTLKKGRDFKLTYKKNKKVGTARVTIRGIGKYKGTRTKKFKIRPDKVLLKSAKTSRTRDGETQISLKVKTKKFKKPTYYQIFIGTDKKCKKRYTNSLVETKPSKSKKYKGLLGAHGKMTKGKTYYVKVRSVKKIGRKTYAGPWSRTLKIKGR